MSSPSREWSWEPRVPIHPSLLEMKPLRIPSPAPDSPEYSCQGSEESSFSGDESCPAREFGEDNALCVSAARPEGRSPKKLRIKLKSRSLGESSQSRPETTVLCVVDAADTLGPLLSRGEEPRVPIHPSLLEMTPLRIPSPAPDSPEYSCQGSEESSFSGDESCPAREFGEDNALCVSGRGVNPYTSEYGATSHGLVGVPPSYPLAARPEGRSPKKLRIKLKSRSLGESSQSRPETTVLCVVDAADTLGPLLSRGEVMPSEPSNNESPLKSSMLLLGVKHYCGFSFRKILSFMLPNPSSARIL
ncbi:hypothetical protein Dimus_020910 [Dionaea muscipula]